MSGPCCIIFPWIRWTRVLREASIGAMFRNRSSLALALLFVAACAADNSPGGTPIPPGSTTRLAVVGPNAINAGHDERVTLQVRHFIEGATETPIENAALTWRIEGDAAGATLDATQSTTDVMGRSSMSLTTGTENTSFSVVVSANETLAATINVSVSSDPQGGIIVNLRYTGDRDIDSFTVRLFRNRCSSLDPERPGTAERISTVSSTSEMPAFAGVSPASNYAILASGETRGDLLATGCTDMIAVTEGDQTGVTVDLSDTAPSLRFEGVYNLENVIDFEGALPPSIGGAVALLDEISDDNDIMGNAATDDWGQDPGAFFVDLLSRNALCKWHCMEGDDFSSCEQTMHPVGDFEMFYNNPEGSVDDWERRTDDAVARDIAFGYDGCDAVADFGTQAQELVNEQLNMRLPGFVTDLTNSLGDLARSINEAQITSQLRLEPSDELGLPTTHQLLEMTVRIRNFRDGMEREYTIDLREAGLRTVRSDATSDADGNMLTIPEHSFNISWGELIQYIYTNALLPALGATSSGDLLESWIDCDALGRSLDMTLDIGALDAMDYAGYCRTGLSAAGTLLDTQIGELITSEEGTLTLGGTTIGAMPNDDNVYTELRNGMWEGSWGEDGMTGDLTGTFTGTLD